MRLPFWIFPVLAAAAWLATLLTLFIAWFAQGRPHYPSMEPVQRIAYISDVGATKLQPLFIVGCVLTAVLLDLAFLAERWLRHKGWLPRNTSVLEKVLSILSILCAILGTVGLICLSIFDTRSHSSTHRLFLFLFMLGYVLSAIFTCWEYQRLGIKYREHRNLRLSFWMKLVFIIVEVALACAFGAMLYKKRNNEGAILEWVVSLIFTFYLLSFAVDLRPAKGTKAGHGHLMKQPSKGRRGKEIDMAETGYYPQDEQVSSTGSGPMGNAGTNGYRSESVREPVRGTGLMANGAGTDPLAASIHNPHQVPITNGYANGTTPKVMNF